MRTNPARSGNSNSQIASQINQTPQMTQTTDTGDDWR